MESEIRRKPTIEFGSDLSEPVERSMGIILEFKRPERQGYIERPSPAMARWLALGAKHENGLLPKKYAPYLTVNSRTIQACVWRGWATETIVGYDEGVVDGWGQYSHPIKIYHITDAGREALASMS